MTFHDGQYDVFKMFDKQWVLAAAGTLEDFDGCTIGWGSLGSLWGLRNDGRLIVTIYVNPLRYTSEYLLKNDCFTVSFFEEKYRRDYVYWQHVYVCIHSIPFICCPFNRQRTKCRFSYLKCRFSCLKCQRFSILTIRQSKKRENGTY